MNDKLKVIGLELLNRSLSIGTIEHCTSGLLGAAISSMCGLSTVYNGTIVCVDMEHIKNLMDVPSSVFKNNGLVSSQVACQMALSGLRKLDTDICVSVVGNVVPTMADDDSDNLVWICVATMTSKKVEFRYEKLEVTGLRGQNIQNVIDKALDVIISEIKRNEDDD